MPKVPREEKHCAIALRAEQRSKFAKKAAAKRWKKK